MTAVLMVLTLVPVACSSGDDGGSPAETVSPTDTADDSKFAFTSTITITADGFRPADAVAVLGDTLTFVNQTTEEQTIRFTNGGLGATGSTTTIGPIPPGQSVALPEPLAAVVSLVYESAGLPGVTGHLQVDPGVDEL